MARADAVGLLGAVEAIHRLGHEALVEGAHRRLDLGFAVRARRLGLGQDLRVRLRNPRLRDPRAGQGRIAPGQPDFRRVSPFRAEEGRGGVDRFGGAAHQGPAVAGVADGGLHHVAEPHGPVLQQELHPRPERSRHHGGHEPRAGDPGDAHLAQPGDGGRPRRDALAAEHPRPIRPGRVDDDRDLAARPVQVRLDDLEGEAGRDGRVEGVAAAFQDPEPDRRGDPMGARDRAERAADLGPGGEAPGHFRRAGRPRSQERRRSFMPVVRRSPVPPGRGSRPPPPGACPRRVR